eukprot:CAMPEP_0167814536 /NCGR_PEP_ID=MMETSP0112_2-20121227/2479_1 /TAXON_ID=91324 /ORGANISM="Lotharella globosa, Strain CCCM811" /LENGTH=82 /DNA_ID=CAMNT_0007713771 /DNA_START=92 /DNA_END=340 /DNA_ORIENTATION=+
MNANAQVLLVAEGLCGACDRCSSRLRASRADLRSPVGSKKSQAGISIFEPSTAFQLSVFRNLRSATARLLRCAVAVFFDGLE